MSVDYRNVIMYGKEFESFAEAMGHLLNTGKIDEDQHDRDLNYFGEPSYGELEWHVYNAFTGGAGVLGVSFSAKTLYTDRNKVKTISSEVDNDIGDGCGMHEFVMVY